MTRSLLMLKIVKTLLLLLPFNCTPANGMIGKWDRMISNAPQMHVENGYVEPFQLFDNVFYVGDKWVSAMLIVSDEGLILIDTLEYPYSQWLPINIRKVGFDPDDLKAIFITHAHSDHIGGAGLLQEITNARIIMLEDDLPLLEQQTQKYRLVRANIDHFPNDSEVFELGNTAIKMYQTPGHTQGCMSLEFAAYHLGDAFRAFVFCGNGTNFQGIGLARKYLNSVERIRKLADQTPEISINLSTHPHLGQIIKKNKDRELTAKNPFIDIDGFRAFLSLLQERGRKKLQLELQRLKDGKNTKVR